MKILFLMDSPEYLRFYDSAVEEMAARGHAVAIAVNSSRTRKPVGLEGLEAFGGRVSVLGVAPAGAGVWSGIAHGLRATMDFVRFLHPRFAAAGALRTRIKRKVLPRAYHWLDAIPRLTPAMVRTFERALMAAERAIPVCGAVAAFLDAESPDVLLVSPLVAAASGQVDWIKAARARGIRTAVCIASWDNLTNKGLLRIEPDLVIVWNDAQKREAEEYHYIPPQRVAVTGAQLFDKWFVQTPGRSREAFCERVGLPDTRPFLLFTGSSGFISESTAEVAFVRRWIEALRAAGDPAIRDLNVLVRPHPYNCHAWESHPLADLPRVAVYPRRGYNPIDPDNRTDFFDSLYHSAAVVGINTSAMIEAAIVGRPVFTLLAEEFAGTQEGTIHFHHLLPEHGGCVRLAQTIDEHVRQLHDTLGNPRAAREETERFVRSFVRPHGLDAPATPIFVDAIERLGRSPAPAPERTPAWGPLLRPLLLMAAAPAALVNWLSRPTTIGRARKRTERMGRRAEKKARQLWTEYRWTAAAHAYVLLVALGLGYFISGAPIQLSDCLRNLLAVQRAGLGDLLIDGFTQPGFFRPLLLPQIDVAFELSGGRYFEMFKAIHIVQVAAAGVLFVNLLRVRSAAGALAVPFGAAMLFGAHTFAGTVVEGFPINTFLTIVVCCLAAANLSGGQPARWRDAVAVALFLFAALTVETGLLVWVALVAAYVAGFRGVSRGALGACTALLAGYMVLRFGPLSVGAPALVERSSGFGFSVLDPPDLVARFGDHPIRFYAYNVASSVSTVLFGEPKAGVWVFARGLVQGDLLPRDAIAVAASTGATLLIGWYVWSRRADWRRGKATHADRWLLVWAAVLAGNAAISYPYTKNVIVSPAGVFHALAGAVAFTAAVARLGRLPSGRSAVAASLVLAALSTLWAVRLAGIHYMLREKAFIARNDWADVVLGRPPAEVDPRRDPRGAALVMQLYDQALAMRVVNPAFTNPAGWRYFEVPW